MGKDFLLLACSQTDLFFSLIEQKCGKINSNVFMSDITDVYYNAWISTMGIPTFKLYCSWHVDRAWKTNLNKIKNTEKKGVGI